MINTLDLKPGDKLALREGLLAEVVENMDDGMWLQIRYLQVPGQEEPSGELELCHAQDIVKVIEG